ncbi:MAG: GYD domain-containing protein [Myxococcales bacterium]|nr:GYD domain-containing protein [Myxococcales bacterium]
MVIEAPDDEAAAKFSITAGALGNVRLETLRAFDEDEYRNLVRGLS